MRKPTSATCEIGRLRAARRRHQDAAEGVRGPRGSRARSAPGSASAGAPRSPSRPSPRRSRSPPPRSGPAPSARSAPPSRGRCGGRGRSRRSAARRPRCACPEGRPARAPTSVATRSISARSSPSTLTPSSLRIPVASISVRVWIGIQKRFGRPGKRTRASSSRSRSSRVSPGRHSARGRSVISVSIIESGAMSVGESERPALPKTRATSGTRRERAVHALEHRGRLRRRHARRRARHVEQRALVEGRHELAAEGEEGRHARGEEGQRRAHHEPGPAHDGANAGRVETHQAPAQGMLVVAADPAANQEGREGRRQRDREQRREGHRVGLREGERPEEAPLAPLEREDRQEGDGDHEQREEEARPHLLHGAQDHLGARRRGSLRARRRAAGGGRSRRR